MIKKVTHVRPKGGPFTHLKVDGTVMSIESAIFEIDVLKIQYQTSPSHILPGANISVITRSDGTQYLRTDQDYTEENNLGGLPEF